MSQLIPKVIFLAIILGYIVFDCDKSLTNLVLAYTVAFLSTCMALAFITRKEWLAGLRSNFDSRLLESMLRFGLPLTLGGLAYWGLTAIDRVFLRALGRFEELGVYSVAVSFAGVATIIQGVFSTVWAPTVYKWASKGEGMDYVYKVVRYILLLVVLVFSVAGLLSWVVPILLPKQYSSVQWSMVACLGAPLLYTLSESTGVGIGITRRSGFAMLAALVAFAANLLGNWLMIPRFGAEGAAASTCLSFWLFFLLRTEFSILLWKFMPRIVLYGYTALAVAGSTIFSLYGGEFYESMIAFWAILSLSALFVFRVEVHEVISFVKKKWNILNQKAIKGV
jgi:O-antigen/teichoic acid export membrane protein